MTGDLKTRREGAIYNGPPEDVFRLKMPKRSGLSEINIRTLGLSSHQERERERERERDGCPVIHRKVMTFFNPAMGHDRIR